MYVIPGPFIDHEGRHCGPKRIHDPDAHDILPEDGREVPETEYWTRRVRDKDVIVVEPDRA